MAMNATSNIEKDILRKDTCERTSNFLNLWNFPTRILNYGQGSVTSAVDQFRSVYGFGCYLSVDRPYLSLSGQKTLAGFCFHELANHD